MLPLHDIGRERCCSAGEVGCVWPGSRAQRTFQRAREKRLDVFVLGGTEEVADAEHEGELAMLVVDRLHARKQVFQGAKRRAYGKAIRRSAKAQYGKLGDIHLDRRAHGDLLIVVRTRRSSISQEALVPRGIYKDPPMFFRRSDGIGYNRVARTRGRDAVCVRTLLKFHDSTIPYSDTF